MRTIRMVNLSTTVKAPAFVEALARMHQVMSRQLTPFWGTEAHLMPDTSATKDQEAIYLLDDSTQADALGWHDLIAETQAPVGFAFARSAVQAGMPWSVPLSHELWEQLVNPWLVACALCPWEGKRAALILEVADPCEGDYIVQGGVSLSDFVAPAWFGANHVKETPLDALGLVTEPATLRPGGYISYSTDLQTWHQAYHLLTPPTLYRLESHVCKYSRSGRRAQLLARM